jgi:hypothetical protein
MLAVVPAPLAAQTNDELKRQLAEKEKENAELRERVATLEKALSADQPAPVSAAPDDDPGNRALERALVSRGSLLLPAFRLEVTPSVGWVHSGPDSSYPIDNAYDSGVGVRLGLPAGFQFEATAPYGYAERGGSNARGLLDISGSIFKQLLTESGAAPSIIADLGWSAATGRNDFDGTVSLGSGFDIPRARLTVLKRVDPLVFVGQTSYSMPLSKQIGGADIRPGSTIGVRAGGSLAVTPDISTSLGVNLGFVRPARRNGVDIAGSDDVRATLETGVGIVLSKRTFLSLNGEFGITGNTPDLAFSVALPIRF